MIFFAFKKFPIGLEQKLREVDNLFTVDKRPVPNVSFVRRFYVQYIFVWKKLLPAPLHANLAHLHILHVITVSIFQLRGLEMLETHPTLSDFVLVPLTLIV